MDRHHVTGWKLDPGDRQRLLERFSPLFPDVIADHVTLDAHADDCTPLPKEERGEIIGEVDDGASIQAHVVRISGTSDRPDGSTFHITWSLNKARGRRAVESNDVIRRLGWKPLEKPLPIRLHPARF